MEVNKGVLEGEFGDGKLLGKHFRLIFFSKMAIETHVRGGP